MKVRLVSSIAVACCCRIPLAVASGRRGNQISLSRWALRAFRITQSKDDEYHPTVELIEKQSGTVMTHLTQWLRRTPICSTPPRRFWYGRLTPSEWRMGFRANPPGARVDERERACLFLERLGFRQSVFAGKFAVTADQVSQRKGGERETLWRRGDALEMVEVRRTGAV